MDKYVLGPRGQFLKPSLEEQVKRLQIVVSKLATELEEQADYLHSHNQQQVLSRARPSVEEMVEQTLYPEHF